MATTWKAPTWRMPNEKNQSKFESYSLGFDGTESINCGSATAYDKFTLSAWVKKDSSAPSYAGIFGSRNGLSSTFIYLLGLDNTGKFRFIADGSTNILSDNVISNDVWYHVVGIADGTTMKMYINGQLQSSTASYSTPLPVPNNNLMIGKQWDTDTQYKWVGEISQCCLFDYALSSTQIASLYNSGSPINPMTLKPAPIAYYPLGGNASTGGDSSNTLSVPNIAVPDASVFDFDGSSDFIDINSLDSSILNSSFSTSIWLKKEEKSGVDDNDRLIDLTVDSNTSLQIITDEAASKFAVNFKLSGVSKINQQVFNSFTSTANEWNQIVLTWDGTSYVYYFNGQPVASTGSTGIGIAGTGFFIGKRADGNSTTFFKGQISNTQIWNTALSSSEVTTLYNSGVPLTGTQPQEANLKAWYKLDQSANWGADAASTWQIPDAVSAYPQSFDISGTSYIKVNRSTSIEPTTDLTVSVWVNWKTGSNTFSYAVNKDYNGSNGSYGITRANQPRFYIFTSTGVVVSPIASSVNLTDTGWHHLVGTYDGSYVRFYVNGEEIGSGTAETGDIIYNTGDLIIGAYQSSGNLSPNGEQSNVQIWDSALSSSQVETLYNNGVPLTTAIATDNLKAWYKLDNNEIFDGTNWEVENQKYPAGFDSALDFVKSESDNVTFGTVSGLVGANDASVSVWFKADVGSSSASEGILDTRAANIRNHGPSIYYQPSTNSIKYTWGITSPSQGYFSATIDSSIVEGQWYNVIVALDVSGTPEIKTYLNGVLKTTNSLISYSMSGSLGNLTIGSRSGDTAYYDGAVSNAAIFNTALDSSAVTALYNNGTPETSISSSPVAWWKLDNTTTGIQDSVGSNNGTNNGATKVNTFVSTEAAISSGMTEQNLVNNNVSALNGESSGMDTSNLVTSTLTRQVPYNSYSMYFDGTGDELDFSSSTFGTGLSNFSVSAWAKFDGSSAYECIASVDGLGGRVWQLFQWSSNRGLAFQLFNNSGTGVVTPINSFINASNIWYHVVGTYDGSNIKLYVDGNLEATVAQTGTIRASTAENLKIGNNGYNEYLDGNISNVSLYDKTLTSTEVLKLYNGGVPGNLSNFNPQPNHWWSLGSDSYYDGSNWICPDLISTLNNTTSNGLSDNSLEGNAPNSTANGTSTNMAIDANLTGNAPNSSNNSFSVNMDYTDRETSVPG